MLGKILVTLAVIAIAVVVVRQRKEAEAESKPQRTSSADSNAVKTETDTPMASDMRTAAYLFLVLMFGTGAIVYYLRWQDDHTVVTVNLFSDGQGDPVTYQVYKYQLDSRSFTTTDGIRITVADNERMEVTGLDSP